MNASGVLFAGTEPSEVFRSEDGGATWTTLPALTRLPSAGKWSFPPRPHTHHVKAILPDRNHPDDLHVAVEAGALVRSYDAGAHWLDLVPSAPRDTQGGRCYGYDSVPVAGSTGKQLVINESEAEVVRRIFAMSADGQSLKTIAMT